MTMDLCGWNCGLRRVVRWWNCAAGNRLNDSSERSPLCRREHKKRYTAIMKKSMRVSAPKPMMEVELEDALDLVGAGKYQVIHCALMLACLISALLEMIGIAFILPAASCDLDIPDSLKGIITSLPNIGVIVTAPFWGRAADSIGRKPVLVVSCTVAGLIGFISAFMPNLISFALCKLAESLFLASPTSLSFGYASEIMPRQRRDKAVLLINGLLTLLTALSPSFAWVILPIDWHFYVGSLDMKSWRILTMTYALPLLLTAVWLTTAEESPKFLMSKGKHHKSLKVLQNMYARNTGLPKESYCVKSLKISEENIIVEQNGSGCELAPQSKKISPLALLRPPHLKWLALTGFLMFGLFTLLNGLYLFTPDLINKAMVLTSEDQGICELMTEFENETMSKGCLETMTHGTFFIILITSVAYAVLVIIACLSPLSKKTLLVSMYAIVGVCCLLTGLLTNRIAAGVAMSALQLTSLGIGPLTAYAVHLFPTSLRGTGLGSMMMFGRIGSTVGANVAGYMLVTACNATFYGFSCLLFLCAALSFLLPSDQTFISPSDEDLEDRSS